MPTTRLRLYRAALRLCGAASIASLTDPTESRRLLDEVWDDGGVRKCLERASWNFALRTQVLDFDPAVDPQFGFTYAFSKSSDWVRTWKICQDEQMQSPLLRYVDEAGYLYADDSVMHVQFVSDDPAYGGDLSTWTGAFADYAAAYFAGEIVHKLTSDKQRIVLLLGNDGSGQKSGMVFERLRTAKSMDAMDGPTQFAPPGTWTRARHTYRGGRGPMGDGGTGGSLIG